MNVKIKYDLHTIKILKITTLISFFFFATAILVPNLLKGNVFAIYYFLFGFYIGGGVFIFSFLNLISGIFYVKRLRKHGYEVPHNRKDYDNRLEQLPRQTEDMANTTFWWCGAIGIIYMVIFLLGELWNTGYYVSWCFMKDNAVVITFFLAIFDLLWLVVGIRYWRQRNNELFRDDVEVDPARKERWPLELAIVLGLIMLVFTCVAKTSGQSMTRYIFASYVATDHNLVCDIRETLENELLDSEDEVQTEQLRTILKQGVYLTEFDTSDLPCVKRVKESLGFDSFEAVNARFRVADGDAKVYVTMEGETVVVTLENPISKVKEPLVAKGVPGERPVIR